MGTTIKKRLNEGINQSQDFIPTVGDVEYIAKLLVSFANSGGGKLYVGVQRNGKIVGVEEKETLQKLLDICKTRCLPILLPEFLVCQDNFKRFVEVTISPANLCFYQVKSPASKAIAYLRQNDLIFPFNKIMELGLKRRYKLKEKKILFSGEEQVVRDLLISNPGISPTQLRKLCSFPQKQIDEILILFYGHDFISFLFSHSASFMHWKGVNNPSLTN